MAADEIHKRYCALADGAYRTCQDRMNVAWMESMGIQVRTAANRPATIDGLDIMC